MTLFDEQQREQQLEIQQPVPPLDGDNLREIPADELRQLGVKACLAAR